MTPTVKRIDTGARKMIMLGPYQTKIMALGAALTDKPQPSEEGLTPVFVGTQNVVLIRERTMVYNELGLQLGGANLEQPHRKAVEDTYYTVWQELTDAELEQIGGIDESVSQTSTSDA